MYWEINVSLDGIHFFATAERSITSPKKLELVYKLIAEKFPEEEGYKISVTKWEKLGTQVEMGHSE